MCWYTCACVCVLVCLCVDSQQIQAYALHLCDRHKYISVLFSTTYLNLQVFKNNLIATIKIDNYV